MALIIGVAEGSPADRAGLGAGMRLISVSGRPIRDVLDYRFYSYDAALTLAVSYEGGGMREVVVRKGEGEDLGLLFDTELMDEQMSCVNQCLFCFIDQLAPGLRRSLYFKDDDARLSFLLGQYITLTNLTRADFGRILDQRISPLHISVHATDPDLRARLLGHPEAGRCLAQMRELAAGGIVMHTQVVVCPGLNDGGALRNTLEDLLALCPAVRSVSVVPAGLTRWREGLYPLRPFDRTGAACTIDLVEALAARCRARHGIGGVYAADEFYLLADRPLPAQGDYDGYPQLENGVGLLASFENECVEALEDRSTGDAPRFHHHHHLLLRRHRPSPFTVATGTAAAAFLSRMLRDLEEAGATIPVPHKVIAVPNRLFGETVTVAGLLCGRDLIDALRGHVAGDRVLIPACMLRHGGDVFLDDLTPEDVGSAIGAEIVVVPVDGGAFVDAVTT